MRKIIFSILFFIMIGHAMSAQEKIRAGYMGIYDAQVLETMASAGMNSALVKFNNVRFPMLASEKAEIIDWARRCKQYGLDFYPVINLWGVGEKRWFEPDDFYSYRGIIHDQTPCPVNSRFYNNIVHLRMIELAELSKTIPIAGILIDLEMYAANQVAYRDYCVCDDCFSKYAKANDIPSVLSFDKRETFLQQNAQVGNYRQFFKTLISQLFTVTRSAVHAINPNLKLGALHLDLDRTFNGAVAMGLGDPARPALAFTEQTYTTGFSDYILNTQRRFARDNIKAELVVGLWQRKIPPDVLAGHCYHSAKVSRGYWIYTLQSMASHAARNRLPFPDTQYWQAYSIANRELDKFEKNTDYISPLKHESFSAPSPLLPDTIQIPSLGVLKQTTDDYKSKTLTFRDQNLIYFNVSRGEEIHFKFIFKKLRNSNSNSSQVGLYGTDGRLISEFEITARKVGDIRHRAERTGTFGVFINGNGNLVELSHASHPYCIDAGRRVGLYYPKIDLFFKAIPATEHIIGFHSDGGVEAYNLIFYDQRMNVINESRIWGSHQVRLDLATRLQNIIIRLKITPESKRYYGDVRITRVNGFEEIISVCENAIYYNQ